MDAREAQVVDAMLDAYRAGAFPMADSQTGRLEWFSPDPRALMPLQIEAGEGPGPAFHVSRSLAAKIRSGCFQLTTDQAFEGVIRSCAEERPERLESWIDDRIVWAFGALHRAGHAHSIEAWLPASDRDLTVKREPRTVTPVLSADRARVLVGGVYGVSIGAAFFAESMFCRPELGVLIRRDGAPRLRPGTDASKVALARLVAHLREQGYELLDVQLRNSHTDQFGVFEVSRREYLRRLRRACASPREWGSLRDPA